MGRPFVCPGKKLWGGKKKNPDVEAYTHSPDSWGRKMLSLILLHTVFLALWRISQKNRLRLIAASAARRQKASRPKPHQITPRPREAHSRIPYRKTWKAHYQKDVLQSLKQNALIKYNRLFLFYSSMKQTHDVFIKCSHKTILLMEGENMHVVQKWLFFSFFFKRLVPPLCLPNTGGIL